MSVGTKAGCFCFWSAESNISIAPRPASWLSRPRAAALKNYLVLLESKRMRLAQARRRFSFRMALDDGPFTEAAIPASAAVTCKSPSRRHHFPSLLLESPSTIHWLPVNIFFVRPVACDYFSRKCVARRTRYLQWGTIDESRAVMTPARTYRTPSDAYTEINNGALYLERPATLSTTLREPFALDTALKVRQLAAGRTGRFSYASPLGAFHTAWSRCI
ncbi:uncharacterized protein SCHCODRAFT_02154172 [Schizophyllum commune H4-8]|uniref:uncharacterized protein n=1 Tax=Schizophyllum commune (strain H4-8 / FGSC 9210) TaxID=578458 RepID=UPI00215F57C2|nr:uncharacterized protein SCHCODRAFT_02154172 [Schizophyllum commune H4-8]KAI5898010.1 hypothetical protein SCHCODRAFT_02154172 [Schizophyllum commune H4-8]